MTRISALRSRLLEPVELHWLAAFRVLYGLMLAVSMLRFIAYGWIDQFFVEPRFHFKYWGFSWVEPLSGPLMHALFGVLAVLALAMAAGFAYRVSALLFALGLAYVQLIDVTTYLNHYYLAGLLGFLLAVSPAHRAWSVDAWLVARLRRARGLDAAPAPRTVARAWLWLFRFQVGIVYVFAGLAKAQADWLLHAQPLSIWLGAVTDLPLVGALFTLPLVPLVLSWCGFLFDSSIVLFLSWARTRPYAYVVVIGFHTLTGLLFPIGMFPVIMVLSALVFFPPSWPRTLLSRARALLGREGRTPTLPSSFDDITRDLRPRPRQNPSQVAWLPTFALLLGAGYCLVQLALPLRFLAYRGNVLWDEQGMRFSWRVMLRAKGGDTTFVVRRKGEKHAYFVSPRSYLTLVQESEMSSQPDLILQLAHHIHDDFVRRGLGPVEVHAESRVSLNGRRSAPFIDPKLDLAEMRDGPSLAHLVLPPPATTPPHTRPVL